MSVQGRMIQVLQVLEERPMTATEVEQALQMSRNYVYYCLKKLQADNLIHVCGWAKSPTGPRRIFKKGPGKDAEKPAAGGYTSKAKPDSVRYLAIQKLESMGVEIDPRANMTSVAFAVEQVWQPRHPAQTLSDYLAAFIQPARRVEQIKLIEREPWRPAPHLRAAEIAAHPRMWTPRTIIASGFQLQGGFD